MKQLLTVDADIKVPGDFLLQVVVALRDVAVPEIMVWSLPSPQAARILVVISAEPERLQALVKLLGDIPGVRQVALQEYGKGPGFPEIPPLLRPAEEVGKEFTD